MKATLLFALVNLFSFCLLSQSVLENEPLTVGQSFEKVYDHFGNSYRTRDLEIVLDRQIGNSYIASTATAQCAFFNVYYDINSGMEIPGNPQHAARRAVICEVLSNVAALLGYNATWPSSVTVNLLVTDISIFYANALGVASGYYAMPVAPTSPNPGIAENLIQKTIISRSNAWNGIIAPLYTTAGAGFYHGLMAFNFQGMYNWQTNYSAVAGPGQFDLYSVALHEITHALGFQSLISNTGISKFGATENYYSIYDSKLRDKNNSYLLTSTSCSSQYGLSFTSNTLNLQPACPCPTCYAVDVTNCSTACNYNSASLSNMSVYTPNCFEAPSSLSHFEDMCYPTTNAANNNQYFVMCNAGNTGITRRFLKQEEKNVLCDLGYGPINTYTSNAVNAPTTYTGTCSPRAVWGHNDGLSQNGAYTYTTATAILTINISGAGGILNNDSPNSVIAACIETVYAVGSLSVSGNIITFTPNVNYTGPVLLRYIPKNSSQEEGNITFIYGYVFPVNCNQPSSCDLVQNGTFEQGFGCGFINATNTLCGVDCWTSLFSTPDVLVAGCSSGTVQANLGINTFSSIPTISSYSINSSKVMGIGWYTANYFSRGSEGIRSQLSSPLQNNQVYSLQFWADQFSGTMVDPYLTFLGFNSFNQSNEPSVLSFATSSLPIAPFSSTLPLSGMQVFQSMTLSPVMNTWQPYNCTFTYTGSNGNYLYVFIHSNNTYSLVYGNTQYLGVNRHYVLLDDISIVPLSQIATFNIPAQICINQSLTNLAQYVSVPGGTFYGTGVSINGTQFDFNINGTLAGGFYNVSYVYYDANNCKRTLHQQITIGSVSNVMSLSYTPVVSCANGGTLSVQSPTAGYTFTWSPGGQTGVTIYITPSVTTIYTVLGSNSSTCSVSSTLQVIPNLPFAVPSLNSPSVCAGGTGTLTAVGNYTSVYWLPSGPLSPTFAVSPTSNSTYTAVLAGANGCTNTNTFYVPVYNYTIGVSAPLFSVCGSPVVTLAPIGTYSTILWTTSTGTSAANPLSVNVPSVGSVPAITLTASYPGCTATAVSNILTYSSPPDFTLTASNSSICSGNSSTISASGQPTNIIWSPGNFVTGSVQVTPTITTVYTATVTLNPFCILSGTLEVVVSNSCCTNSVTSISNLAGTNLISGSNAINFNMPLGVGTTTISGELMFAPNVKITVPTNGHLVIQDAHLYACSGIMWDGIELLDGARITFTTSNKDNLVEDAKTAVSIISHTASNQSSILYAEKTTFNKNYVAIDIRDFKRNISTYPFKVKNCVFTCRNLPFTSTAWPQTGTVSTTGGTTADLRYCTGGTYAQLSPPFLNQSGFTITNLKTPYLGQASSVAIRLVDVGLSNSAVVRAITIGDPGAASSFNVFDGHKGFIDAVNCNINSYNNIFQNTQTVTVNQLNSAIRTVNTYTNTSCITSKLDLLAPNNPTAAVNRFYNCHIGIEAKNQATLDIEYAEFRSTQSKVVQPNINNQGFTAIWLESNRYHKYAVYRSRFVNVNNSIFCMMTSGYITQTFTGQAFGTFSISGNFFSAVDNTLSPIGNNYLDNSVFILNAIGNTTSTAVPSFTTIAPNQGIKINFNNFYKVNHAVELNTANSAFFQKVVSDNIIYLTPNVVSLKSSFGVSHTNCKQSTINSNTVVGYTNAGTNTATAIYSKFNTSTSIQCNSVVATHKGFYFENTNLNMIWRRNYMLSNNYGMYGVNWGGAGGGIGQQGNLSTPSDNSWQGAWGPPNSNHIFTDINSNAQNSQLFTRSGATYIPSLCVSSNVANQSYVALNNINTSANGLYQSCPSANNGGGCNGCNNKQSQEIALDTASLDDPDSEINQFILYIDLLNDSTAIIFNDTLNDFFNYFADDDIGTLNNIEAALAGGDFESAHTLLDNYKANTNIQQNYFDFYSLYYKYYTTGELSTADSILLNSLCFQCPDVDGLIIYNARVLWTIIYGELRDYDDFGCSETGYSRAASTQPENQPALFELISHEQNQKGNLRVRRSRLGLITIYPNPASEEITIRGLQSFPDCRIEIRDVAGRIALEQTFMEPSEIQSMRFALENGVYLLTIFTKQGCVSRKIIVCR